METRPASGRVGAKREASNLTIEVASGDAFDVREFSIKERISSLFEVELFVFSEDPDVDFDAIVGRPARFTLDAGRSVRVWSGILSLLEQTGIEEKGLSGYRLLLVPELWLLTQRRNYRMFQQISEPDIVLALLSEWNIEPIVRLDRSAYKTRKYRVQYAESDYAFMSRMLEDAGISFYFEEHESATHLVLSDAPHTNEARPVKLAFFDSPDPAASTDWVSKVKVAKRIRPGKYTMRDHDYRLQPHYKLAVSASGGNSVEEKLERYHYTPGAFLFGTAAGESTPAADDRGRTRTDEAEAAKLARSRLDAKRSAAKVFTFQTNAYDIAPGMVVHFLQHPRTDLGEQRPLLVVESAIEGTCDGEWTHQCEARSAETPYRPALVTPKPKVNGVESATVVGPPGEEIHTDEFGRVRVHFHWDRESRMDDKSSCWIHASQPWGGTGFGAVSLPRIGQEVLVDFLGGDPDRPVIVGRVYTNLQKVPYGLPANKTRSGWKSNSTGGTGGYNEIMFEDAAGRELFNVQAERDLNKLVKHDETVTIGNDRSKTVGRDDELKVKANRTKRVGGTEQNAVGLNQTLSVGVNRSTQVGRIDSTIVGEVHTVMVMPPGEGNTECTHITCEDDKVTISTPDQRASIVLDGDKILIKARFIEIHGEQSIDAHADEKASFFAEALAELRSRAMIDIIGEQKVLVQSKQNDVVIQGGPMVLINPEVPATTGTMPAENEDDTSSTPAPERPPTPPPTTDTPAETPTDTPTPEPGGSGTSSGTGTGDFDIQITPVPGQTPPQDTPPTTPQSTATPTAPPSSDKES